MSDPVIDVITEVLKAKDVIIAKLEAEVSIAKEVLEKIAETYLNTVDNKRYPVLDEIEMNQMAQLALTKLTKEGKA